MRWAILAAYLIAMAAAIWSAVGCPMCHGLDAAFSSLPLAWAGLGAYPLAAWLHATRLRHGGWQAASLLAGFHLFLLFLLWRSASPCAPCLLAAGAVLVAAAFSLGVARPLNWQVALTVMAGVLAARGALAVDAAVASHRVAAMERAAGARASELATPWPEGTTLTLVVFADERCPACRGYLTIDLPQLSAQWGARLRIVRAEPTSTGLPIPFTVAIGSAVTTWTGRVPFADLLRRLPEPRAEWGSETDSLMRAPSAATPIPERSLGEVFIP